MSLKNTIYNHRKTLNSCAEIGFKEFKTNDYIKNYLNKIGVSYESYLETAIVGKIMGKCPKKTIAFRADMDGLNVEDSVMHVCGHDGHMSILLGLIEFINENRENLKDNIVFIFQPAEETPGGAKPLIEEGIFKKYEIDEIYGLHMYPEIEEGLVGIRPNHFLAQTGEVNIEVFGKGGHGAMPQNGIDAVVIASNLVTMAQSIVSRSIPPLDSAVLSIGTINGGSKRNIICEHVTLEGTMRAFKPHIYENIKSRIKEIAKGLEIAYNCKISINIKDDYPSVNNDENMYLEFIKAIEEENVKVLEPLMISEDFSYYQKVVPGLFFMLGCKNEEKGYVNGLHNINFNFDESVLVKGLDIYIKLLKHKGALM